MENAKPTRAERTRDALLTTGFELLAERPVEGISIDELISVAGVGKGSFFNHFGDKDGFKAAIAERIRADVEAQIGAANAEVTDPLERLVGGMREAVRYALEDRCRTLVMLRLTAGATTNDYPLNAGIFADVEACAAAGRIAIERTESAVLYWLGLCVALITYVVENELTRDEAAERLREMSALGLRGLGVPPARVRAVSVSSAKQLLEAGDEP